ncbi:copper resistance CopC/CopD family protein [Oerskovia jenensis]|uniref:Copper transport protein n=1 Tax=Oerskovia jenensis TaxID=162169 RepID=A0ABS2LJE4_9CELL|nr:copper resistance protein CopC [Oerskovia jenensis]MBM7480549.1 copper transport protein [Oerskovia jenensis]
MLLVLLAGLGTGALAGAAPVAAHAILVDTSPRQGATSDTSPERVVLRFDEPVTVLDGSLVVSDLRGERWDLEQVTTTDGGHTVSVALPPDLPDGQYLASWRLLSLDTHVTGGSIDFTVGTRHGAPGTHPTGPEAPGTSPLGASARGIVAVGTSLLAGVALSVLAIGRGRASGLAASPRIRRLEVAGLGLLVLGTGLGLATQVADLSDRRPVDLLDTEAWAGVLASSGPWLLARSAALLGWVGLWIWQSRSGRGPRDGRDATGSPARLATVALAVTLAASIAAGGHAGAEPDPWLTLTVTTAHVLAAGIWVGGLALLATHLRGPWRTALVTALPAWSTLALITVVVLVATGTLQAARALGPVAALWSTGYGRLLLAKVLVVIGLLLVANVARRAVPAARRSAGPVVRVHRTVLVEMLLVVLVLALSAALAATAPGRATYSPPWAGTVQLGPVTAALSIEETRSGPQVIRIDLSSADGTEVLPDSLDLTVTQSERGIGPLPVVLRRDYARAPATVDTADDVPATVYVSEPTVVPAPGTWEIDVLVTLDEVTAYSARVTYVAW